MAACKGNDWTVACSPTASHDVKEFRETLNTKHPPIRGSRQTARTTVHTEREQDVVWYFKFLTQPEKVINSNNSRIDPPPCHFPQYSVVVGNGRRIHVATRTVVVQLQSLVGPPNAPMRASRPTALSQRMCVTFFQKFCGGPALRNPKEKTPWR